MTRLTISGQIEASVVKAARKEFQANDGINDNYEANKKADL